MAGDSGCASGPARASVIALIRDSDIRAGAVRKAVQNIIVSRVFCRSDRLCAFLSFVVERSLEGSPVPLKEYLIATEVYGRPASFDSRVDPIVRVEARRLRGKLSVYYQTEGRNEDLEIALPVGTYLPVIIDRRAYAGDQELFREVPEGCLEAEPIVVLDAQAGTSLYGCLWEEIIHRLYVENLWVCVSGAQQHEYQLSPGGELCPIYARLEVAVRG